MEAKNWIVAGVVLILATGSYLFLNSDFDGDNLTVWDEVLTHGATPFSRDIPEDYYRKNGYRSYREPQDLENFIESLELPHELQEGVFDCSESAAYVEWALERAGFDARIATGPAPQGFSQGNHAWVFVHLDGSRVPVEPTTLTVIREGDLAENDYLHSESEHSNIWETIRATGNVGEWDWWKNASGDPFR